MGKNGGFRDGNFMSNRAVMVRRRRIAFQKHLFLQFQFFLYFIQRITIMASGGQISYEQAIATLSSMFPRVERSIVEAVLELNRA